MRIGILETGPVPEELASRHGTYPEMFDRMLKSVRPDIETVHYAVIDGILPDAPEDADGWIITGSRYGAYEDHPWIPPLEEFIRASARGRVPMAGFCFGHQIIAQALGGKVVKSTKGWGLGVHSYKTEHLPDWMGTKPSGFSTIAVHQDQVVELPDDATRIATSDFCENAALVYGDPKHPYAFSVQPHPEFEADFVADLISVRRGTAFPNDIADAALQTLDRPLDNLAWGRWVVAFFEAATATVASDG